MDCVDPCVSNLCGFEVEVLQELLEDVAGLLLRGDTMSEVLFVSVNLLSASIATAIGLHQATKGGGNHHWSLPVPGAAGSLLSERYCARFQRLLVSGLEVASQTT
jgi:hypothetical protein